MMNPTNQKAENPVHMIYYPTSCMYVFRHTVQLILCTFWTIRAEFYLFSVWNLLIFNLPMLSRFSAGGLDCTAG